MKEGKYTQTLDDILHNNEGIITAAEATAAGVPKEAFYRYVQQRDLEKQSHGIYLTRDSFPDEFLLLQMRFPKAIFSYDSASFLHNMSEREPVPLSVTVESSYNSQLLREQGVQIHYVVPKWYDLGICEVRTPEGNIVKAYNKERTVCDLIRKRSSTDITEFNYAMRAYIASRDKDLGRLSDYVRMIGIESQVWNVIGVLL